VKNLTIVLTTVNQRDDQFNQLDHQYRKFVSGLAANVARSARRCSRWATWRRRPVTCWCRTAFRCRARSRAFNQVASELDKRRAEVTLTLKNLPLKMERLGKVGSYGSWFPVLSVRY